MWTVSTTIQWQMKSTVFRQLNISNISLSQADIPPLPKITYGIWLKGSSFLKNSLLQSKLLKESLWTCFHLEKKKKEWGSWAVKKGLNSARTLPPFTLGVVQRCVCFQKCEQTFVTISCHFHPGPLKKSLKKMFKLWFKKKQNKKTKTFQSMQTNAKGTK